MLQKKSKTYSLLESQQGYLQNWRQLSVRAIKSIKSYDHTQKHNLLLFLKNQSRNLILHNENLNKELKAGRNLKKTENKLHKQQMKELNCLKNINGKFWHWLQMTNFETRT